MIEPQYITIHLNFRAALTNKTPLTQPEIDSFSQLIEEARYFNQTLAVAQVARYLNQMLTDAHVRADVLPCEELCIQMMESKDLADPSIQQKMREYAIHHSSQTSSQAEQQVRNATQTWLNSIYKIVQFMRKRGETVEWECDLSETISLMEENIRLLELFQLKDCPPETINLMREELEAHRNPSSELFLRCAIMTRAENTSIISRCATKCHITFQALFQTLTSTKSRAENYKLWAQSVMTFAHAFFQYKIVASQLTNMDLRFSVGVLRKKEEEDKRAASNEGFCIIS